MARVLQYQSRAEALQPPAISLDWLPSLNQRPLVPRGREPWFASAATHDLTPPAVAIDWFVQASEPVRRRVQFRREEIVSGPDESTFTVVAFDPANGFPWPQQSEPVRLKQQIVRSAIVSGAPDSLVGFNPANGFPWPQQSEPVRTRRQIDRSSIVSGWESSLFATFDPADGFPWQNTNLPVQLFRRRPNGLPGWFTSGQFQTDFSPALDGWVQPQSRHPGFKPNLYWRPWWVVDAQALTEAGVTPLVDVPDWTVRRSGNHTGKYDFDRLTKVKWSRFGPIGLDMFVEELIGTLNNEQMVSLYNAVMTGDTLPGSAASVGLAMASGNWVNQTGNTSYVDCQVVDDLAGTNPGATVRITLPRTAERDPNVRAGDVLGYVTTDGGENIPVTDYLDEKIGARIWWPSTTGIRPGWAADTTAAGHFIVSRSAGDPNFGTAGATGGSTTTTINVAGNIADHSAGTTGTASGTTGKSVTGITIDDCTLPDHDSHLHCLATSRCAAPALGGGTDVWAFPDLTSAEDTATESPALSHSAHSHGITEPNGGTGHDHSIGSHTHSTPALSHTGSWTVSVLPPYLVYVLIKRVD